MSAFEKIEELGASLILTRGTHFEGKLSFEGIARVCGSFKGDIHSPGTLIIEQGARVFAQMEVCEVIIKGTFRGDITASRQITLLSGCECYGTLTAPHLHIEKGALFEGHSVKKK